MPRSSHILFLLFFALLWQGCSQSMTSVNGRLPYNDVLIPQTMRDTLWDDAARLALNAAIAADSSYVDTVTIPEKRIKLYYQDLVNLYNAHDIAVRDSVLVFYPTHAISPEIHLLYVSPMRFTDSIPPDSTMRRLCAQFHLDSVVNHPFLLRSPVACNAIALASEINRTTGDVFVEPEVYSFFGCASNITASASAGSRMYDYRYCWGDVGSHDWFLSVDDTGGVKYLGSSGEDVPPR